MQTRDTQGKELAREARAMSIYELGKLHKIDSLKIEKAITDNWSVKRWKNLVFDEAMGRTILSFVKKSKPKDQFSLCDYIRDKMNQKPTQPQNQRIIDEETESLTKEKVTNKRGDFIPESVLNPISKRDLTASTPSAGGVTIDDKLQNLIPPLDKDFPIQSLSTSTTSTLPYTLPKVTSTTQGQWTGEINAATKQNLTFESIRVVPKYLRVFTSVSRGLIQNSSIAVENFVRSDLRLALREGIERAAIQATGGGQPTGLQYNPNIPTVSYTAGSLNYDTCSEAEAAILGANLAVQHARTHTLINGEQVTSENSRLYERLSLDWVCSPSFKRSAKSTPQLPNGSLPIWDTGDVSNDTLTIYGQGMKSAAKILDYNAHISPFVAVGEAYFGNFREHLISSTGPIEILVDPFSESTRGFNSYQRICEFRFFNAS